MSINLIVIGAGGHGQVVVDAALRMCPPQHSIRLVGFLDDRSELFGASMLGLRVLGPTAALNGIAHDAVILGIGDNAVRRGLYERLRARGELFYSVVHPSAVVGRDVTIGAGSFVAAGVVINTGTVIGRNCILNTACSVDHHNVVDDHAHVAPGVHTGGEVEIGEGALLGIGSTIVPQRRIGAWSIVAAGACVTQSVPPGVTVAGVPARARARAAA